MNAVPRTDLLVAKRNESEAQAGWDDARAEMDAALAKACDGSSMSEVAAFLGVTRQEIHRRVARHRSKQPY